MTQFIRSHATPLAAVAFCLAFAMYAGQEMSWDVLNHHYYIPFAWMHGRVFSDYFGAGPQAYQNPVGYLPFYWMVQAGLPQWAIGVMLACLHALCAVACWSIARRIWSSDGLKQGNQIPVALATGLAVISPVFLQALGTSSNDPLGASLILAALALMLGPVTGGSMAPVLTVGVLLGAAVGIKLSNLPLAAACGVVGIYQVIAKRAPVKALGVWVGGATLGFTLAAGWSVVALWNQFGNPFFPLLNNLFHSPLGPDGAFNATRFVPGSLPEGIAKLFEMAVPRAYVYSENFAPDLRPAAALLTLAALAVYMVYKASARRARAPSDIQARLFTPADRDLTLFLVTATFLWLVTSGNGRYAIPVLMVAGIAFMRWLWLLLPPRLARSLGLFVCAVQLPLFLMVGDIHRNAEPWSRGPFFLVGTSERLRDEPFLHLTLGIQSHASVAAAGFAAGGALANPIGQYSIPYEGARGAPLRALLAKWHGRTRVLVRGFTPADAPANQKAYDDMLVRLRMAVDWSDCEPAPLLRQAGFVDLLSCAVHPRAGGTSAWESERPTADRVFARLERACPDLYGPGPVVTERIGDAWRRFYANSDTHVLVSMKAGVYTMHARDMRARRAGSADEVLAGRAKFDCTPWVWTTPNL